MIKNLVKVMFGVGAAALFASAHACGGSSATTTGPDAGPVADCFTGTPTTNDQIQNACTPDTVVKVLKVSSVSRGKANLPPLP